MKEKMLLNLLALDSVRLILVAQWELSKTFGSWWNLISQKLHIKLQMLFQFVGQNDFVFFHDAVFEEQLEDEKSLGITFPNFQFW